MKFLSQLLAAMLLCILVACKNETSKPLLASSDIPLPNHSEKSKEKKEAYGVADSVAMPQKNTGKQAPTAVKSDTKEDWDKKIIKTGNLTLEVKKYETYNDLLHTGIKKFGGYIAQEEQNQSDYKIENSITIKVPVDQFDDALVSLVPANEKLVEKKITSEDVTGQLIDTKSRMEARKKVRDRYLDMLKQAKNMEEILQVQNEINGIQENIEAAAGRIDYLGHESAFSTINITFYQVLNPEIKNNPGPSYGVRVLESLKSGLNWFAELFVILVSLWPLWIGIIVAWFFIRKKIKIVKNPKSVA